MIKYKIKYLYDKILILYIDFDYPEYKKNLNRSLQIYIEKFIFTPKNIKNCICYIIKPLSNYNFSYLHIFTAAYEEYNSYKIPLTLSSYISCNQKNLLYFGFFNKNFLYNLNINNKNISIIDFFKKYIKKYIKTKNINKKNLIFLGISIGGNASIYLSSFFNKSKCFVFSPILINIELHKNIYFDSYENTFTNIININDLLKEKKYNYIYIAVPKYNKLGSDILDSFYSGSLINNKNNIFISILNYDIHDIVSVLGMWNMLTFIENNIELLTKNFNKYKFFTILNSFYHNLYINSDNKKKY